MHSSLIDARQAVQLDLVGVGGTGSLILTHLVRLDQAVRSLGGKGLHVRAFDPDLVSVTNLTRQNFAPSDVGRSKAVTLVERCNLYAGLGWQAFQEVYTPQRASRHTHIVITCVDSGQARREVHAAMADTPPLYWLDCGNAARSGQVVLGCRRAGLPDILEVDPEGMQGEDDDSPSCSAAEALTRQHLLINPTVALQAVTLLSDLLLHGQVEAAEVYVRLSGVQRVLAKTLSTSNPPSIAPLLPHPDQVTDPPAPRSPAKRRAPRGKRPATVRA